MSTELQAYQSFVDNFLALHKDATNLPLGTSSPAPKVEYKNSTCLLFAPHPDDEGIIGALPLRLRQEENVKVINVAVTLGSNKDRQAGRKAELIKACDTLGFELLIAGNQTSGLEKVTPATRDNDAAAWQEKVDIIKAIVKEHQPDYVICPHDDDFNSSHIGTHYVLIDALKQLAAEQEDFATVVIESEFWGIMKEPNLLVGVTSEDEARMIYSVSAHTGEVERNPYHIKHPCRMHDNVLRASEVIGGQGGEGAAIDFGMIYRASTFAKGELTPCANKVLAPSDSLAYLANLV